MVGELCCENGIYVVPESVSRNMTVEQYIGLKDRNEAEIYEGDLVELFGDSDEIYEVVYDTYDDFPNPAFVLEREDGRGDWFAKKDRKIVGNTHEGIFKDNAQVQTSP